MGDLRDNELDTSSHDRSITIPNTLPSFTQTFLSDYQYSLEGLGRSSKTISSYLGILIRYFSFLQSEGTLTAIEKMGRRELNTYLLHLRSCHRWPNRPASRGNNDKPSPFTIQDHARAIKVFWSWLLREGYLDKNPLEKFPLPSVPKNIIQIIEPDIFEKILALIDRSTPKGVQRYCIMLVLYDGGLRISETLEILLENVDFKIGSVRVIGKGLKQRDVPLSNLTIREIRRYMREFRPQICPNNSLYLFPKPDGNHVTVNCVQQFMRRLAKKSGIVGLRLYPHLLRHTFGTQFIINGGNVFFLKEIMGHASLSTTLKYTHLQSEDLRREHSKYSPIWNLRLGQKTTGA